MAKVCMIEREKKRAKLIAKYAAKRQALKATIKNPETDPAERVEAVRKLADLPRNASPTRLRNRCELTGRPHGYYRKFGLARNELRRLAMQGDIPGLVKASW